MLCPSRQGISFKELLLASASSRLSRSSDNSCGKYESRTLLVCRHHRWRIRQPTVQSKVRERNLKVRGSCFVPLVHVSGEKVRMATLFRVSHPDTWGENPDERRFFCISSGFLGRFPGRKLLQNAVKVFPGRHKSECFPMRNPSRRKSECFTICYTNKHKPRSASLQVSLAGTALNLWRSFLTSMMLATQIASGGRICQRRRSLEFKTHIFTLDPWLYAAETGYKTKKAVHF